MESIEGHFEIVLSHLVQIQDVETLNQIISETWKQIQVVQNKDSCEKEKRELNIRNFLSQYFTSSPEFEITKVLKMRRMKKCIVIDMMLNKHIFVSLLFRLNEVTIQKFEDWRKDEMGIPVWSDGVVKLARDLGVYYHKIYQLEEL